MYPTEEIKHPGQGLPGWISDRVGSAPEPPQPPTDPRKPKRPGTGIMAAIVAAATVGFFVAQAFDDDGPSTRVVVDRPVNTGAAAPPASSGSVTFVAQKLSPSVVQIETGSGVGSGVVYDSDGLILTAAHVVSGSDLDVTVRLPDGSRVSAQVLGTHDATDVAVLKADATGLRAAELADGVPLQVGQLAVAIGSPFGLEGSVTAGVVSAVDRTIGTTDGYSATVIQTDAPINPGNSGGALADSAGRVIGINDAIRSDSGVNAGVGFAIPIDIAKTVADAIVRGEEPQLGFLGVSGTDPTDGSSGALVVDIEPGSAAEDAGLRPGDIIQTFDGQAVEGMSALAGLIRRTAPGTTVTLEILRDGNVERVDVTIGGA